MVPSLSRIRTSRLFEILVHHRGRLAAIRLLLRLLCLLCLLRLRLRRSKPLP